MGVKIIDSILTTYNFEGFLSICKNYEIEKLTDLPLISKEGEIKIIENVNKVFYPMKLSLKTKNCIVYLQKMGYKYKDIYQAVGKVDQKLKEANLIKEIILKINEANQQQI